MHNMMLFMTEMNNPEISTQDQAKKYYGRARTFAYATAGSITMEAAADVSGHDLRSQRFDLASTFCTAASLSMVAAGLAKSLKRSNNSTLSS
jgi:sulfite exporter TauE/SafE